MRDEQERAWEVVKRAYLDRPPANHRGNRLRNGAFLAVAVAVAAAVVSPPGRAVFERVREAVGVQHAEPALFSLPASGRLLVVSEQHGGLWLVRADGFKRRIGSFDDAQWSPHGLYLVATKGNELVALDAEGNVRWTLARRDPSSPRWEGTRTDTRIAYFARSGLRIVAGDGTGDKLLAADVTGASPAWDPARLHTLAYASRGAVVLRNADTGRTIWHRAVEVSPTSLQWSSDGRELAVISARSIVVLDASGQVRRTVSMLGAALAQAAFAPGSHRLAVALRLPGRSEVRLVDVDRPGRSRLLFAGPGRFGDVAWSPNAQWLLVAWPTANQWLFLHGAKVHAVANIEQQFPRSDHIRPTLELAGRWCCR